MKRIPNKGRDNLLLAAALAAILLNVMWLFLSCIENKPNIKIGVLYSPSSTMAPIEIPLVDAVRLAVEEANQSGGLNGQAIGMIIADCRSDAVYCA